MQEIIKNAEKANNLFKKINKERKMETLDDTIARLFHKDIQDIQNPLLLVFDVLLSQFVQENTIKKSNILNNQLIIILKKYGLKNAKSYIRKCCIVNIEYDNKKYKFGIIIPGNKYGIEIKRCKNIKNQQQFLMRRLLKIYKTAQQIINK